RRRGSPRATRSNPPLRPSRLLRLASSPSAPPTSNFRFGIVHARLPGTELRWDCCPTARHVFFLFHFHEHLRRRSKSLLQGTISLGFVRCDPRPTHLGLERTVAAQKKADRTSSVREGLFVSLELLFREIERSFTGLREVDILGKLEGASPLVRSR